MSDYPVEISTSAVILSARFVPSVIYAGDPALLQVAAVEVQNISRPQEIISGEFVSGEV